MLVRRLKNIYKLDEEKKENGKIAKKNNNNNNNKKFIVHKIFVPYICSMVNHQRSSAASAVKLLPRVVKRGATDKNANPGLERNTSCVCVRANQYT